MTSENPVLTARDRRKAIQVLKELPAQLDRLTQKLSPAQLTTKPNPGSWSVAQIIHHLADAHMNSYIRTKRILAEDKPDQRPFSQENWVDMADEANLSVDVSCLILRGVHLRWVTLFESLTDADWAKIGYFRSDGSEMTIDYLLNSYANHSQAHLTQIEQTLAELEHNK